MVLTVGESCGVCSDIDSAASQQPTLIVPDKDADGLSAGVIVHRTLTKLGLDEKHLDVHLVQKGSNIHAEDERQAILAKNPKFIIVLDQGSRGGPPVIDSLYTRSLIIDHHLSDEFPRDATVVKPFEALDLGAHIISGSLGMPLSPCCYDFSSYV